LINFHAPLVSSMSDSVENKATAPETAGAQTKSVPEASELAPSSGPLIITRTFNAPVDNVWRCWADSELSKQWWGPANFDCPYYVNDFRVGGKYVNAMRDIKTDKHYWGTGITKEIVPGKKIVYTDSFADGKEGNIVSSAHYGMPGLPLEMLVTVDFEKLGDNQTKMTITHAGMPDRDKVECNRAWNESLDKMQKIVEQAKA
jgi:uncharacterized protein YndB with AHSA1/START domain